VNFLDLVQFFRFLKGRCHGNRLKSKNWRFYGPIYFVVLPFGKGLQYRNSDFKIRQNEYLYIMCNFGDIRSRNVRVYAVNNSTFCGNMAKIGISRQISQCPGHILTYFTGLVSTLVGMIFQVFVWQSPKGRCYDNQLNMADVRKRRVGPPLLLALAFDNGLADRKSAFKRFNGNNHATSCPNLVNFRPVISEFMLLNTQFLPQFARNFTTIFIRHVGVSKRIGRSQF